jgi:hypothetical protein
MAQEAGFLFPDKRPLRLSQAIDSSPANLTARWLNEWIDSGNRFLPIADRRISWPD